MLIIGIAGYPLVFDAIASTDAVEGGTVALVAIIGVGIKIVSALMFARGPGRDVNLRAAFVHRWRMQRSALASRSQVSS